MGLGCELLYTDEDGIPRFVSIDPKECIFVMDDSIQGNLTAFIRLYPNADEPDLYNLTVYTKTDYKDYRLSMAVSELRFVNENIHFFGDVPAILYPGNPEYSGTFEGVMPLQDAINIVMSDEINDFEGFVDAILAITGGESTQPEDIVKMKRDRVLLLSNETKAEWLIKNVNPSHIEQLKSSIITKIHEMGSIPDIERLGSFGTSGVALQYKLIGTEMQASGVERVVYRGLQRRLELLYNILRLTDSSIGLFTDVRMTFDRNFIMAFDELNRKRLDLALVDKQIMSKTTFLQQHKDMAPEEAEEELRLVKEEDYGGLGSMSYTGYDPELSVERNFENDRT